jgi:hypothetical protein
MMHGPIPVAFNLTSTFVPAIHHAMLPAYYGAPHCRACDTRAALCVCRRRSPPPPAPVVPAVLWVRTPRQLLGPVAMAQRACAPHGLGPLCPAPPQAPQ